MIQYLNFDVHTVKLRLHVPSTFMQAPLIFLTLIVKSTIALHWTHLKNNDIDGTCKWTLGKRLHVPVLFCGRYWLMMSCMSSASGASPPPPPGGATIVVLFPCDVLDLRSSEGRDDFVPLDFLQVKHILRYVRLSCINFHVLNHVMAHLHCRRWTLVQTRTLIPVLYKNREKGSESKSVQCEHVLHSAMWPSGLESESESITKSVSGNVINQPLKACSHLKFASASKLALCQNSNAKAKQRKDLKLFSAFVFLSS